ncbi:MAG: hypothetical protein NXH75_08315 [Halobacteriovoraceae bacterium]|nr:hypothetical protein [Halobacteriovoraceae bacterium]
MEQQLANILLYLFATYHILGGVFSLGPQNWTKKFGEKLYSLDFPDQFNPHYQLTVRSLGAFALFTGIISILIATTASPKLKSYFLGIYGVLFLGRAILRIVQRDLFKEAYNIDFDRSLKNVAFNIGLTLFCWYVAYKLYAKSTSLLERFF